MGGAALGRREDALSKLAERRFDVLVIGGGITGAGVALDAATRGLSVALIERGDFACGTSSRSTKLVHGGLRYLEQRDFGLTYEALHERDLLRRLAPHLVRPIPFFWPKWAGANAKGGLGLWIYDAMAGMRNLRRHTRAGEAASAAMAPSLRRRSGGYVYYDAQTDDVRLTLAVLRTAVSSGAVVCNHLEASSLLDVRGRVVGCVVTDGVGGTSFEIRAGDVVNATGVWADEMRVAEDPSAQRNLRPSKGIHLVIERRLLPLQAAVLFPAEKRKLVFAIPWRSSVIIGTTDEGYSGPLDSPCVEPDEADYLLDAASRAFELDLDMSGVTAAYAGLRPLLSDPRRNRTRDLSRRHAILRGPRGLITVTGGKLTTYRKMAEEVVDLVARRQGRVARCVTKATRLGVADVDTATRAVSSLPGGRYLPPEVIDHLVFSYGDDAVKIVSEGDEMGTLNPLIDGLPYLVAEARWAVTSEMAMLAGDVLERRMRIGLESADAGASSVPQIEKALSSERDGSADRFGRSLPAYLDRIAAERGPVATGQIFSR